MAERAKNKKLYTIHKTDIVINKGALSQILASRDMDFKQLHGAIVEEYGLDISYKGFMSLLDNRSSWKLIYAWSICEVLHLSIPTIFNKKKINVEEKIKEKEEWKKKYQR